MLDGIHTRWATELRCLGIGICWIPSKRNVVADALSRSIFSDENGEVPSHHEFGQMSISEKNEPLWIWKDGKSGHEELLMRVSEPLRERELRKLVFEGGGSTKVLLEQDDKSTMKCSMTASLRVQEEQNMRVVLMANLCKRNLARDGNLDESYSNSSWYDDISKYLLHRRFSKDCKTKVQQTTLIRKINHFSVAKNGDLYYELRGISKRCLTEQEVASALKEAHDNGGHFS
ncbi:hypothetical protein GcM1_141006 [Golovinomyces cichoracearum]|uniref:Uncharacterized protein n=1 Tax=Golovinomyces cichoracearum TaxID=62708 RepID=A0A420JBR8_9PEZI|nr:hypothetical protein GcM1_141006 [Golovinomyces cichoracearum]